MCEAREKVARVRSPGRRHERTAEPLASQPARPAGGRATGAGPEACGSRRNGNDLGGGPEGGGAGTRGPSRTRPQPLTCGTHKVARLRDGDRHSATRRRNVVIKLRLASRLPWPGGKRTATSASSYLKGRVRKGKAGGVYGLHLRMRVCSGGSCVP